MVRRNGERSAWPLCEGRGERSTAREPFVPAHAACRAARRPRASHVLHDSDGHPPRSDLHAGEPSRLVLAQRRRRRRHVRSVDVAGLLSQEPEDRTAGPALQELGVEPTRGARGRPRRTNLPARFADPRHPARHTGARALAGLQGPLLRRSVHDADRSTGDSAVLRDVGGKDTESDEQVPTGPRASGWCRPVRQTSATPSTMVDRFAERERDAAAAACGLRMPASA